MVFDGLRQSFDDLLRRATRPEDRHQLASRMKETLVQARLGLDDLRAGLEQTRRRLVAEEQELATVRRRRQLAEGIDDRQTVEIATKYEETYAERVEVLRRKVAAQEAEVALGEREVGAMSAELRAVLAGTDPRVSSAATGEPAAGLFGEEAEPLDPEAARLQAELDALGRQRTSAQREADAERRLDELKRRMGK